MTAEPNDSSGFADNEMCDTAANTGTTAVPLSQARLHRVERAAQNAAPGPAP